MPVRRNEEYGDEAVRISRMKSFFTAPTDSAVRAFCAASLLSFLAACATVATSPRHETDEQALDEVRTARAVLDCTQSCAGAWRHNRSELITRYNAGDWRGLAVLVMQIDYRQDLAYFYLGRAAEGLGENAAALVYYKTAEALATATAEDAKCATSTEGCNGLSLLTEVLTRAQIVDASRSRNAGAARRQQHARQGPGQPATSGQPTTDNWVDPPPVNQ
jgi:hypothetical protein